MYSAPALTFVMLHVHDIDAAFRYFSDQLGMIHIPDQDAPAFRMFAPMPGGISFGIVNEGADGPKPGSVELIFSTPDLEGVRTTLVGRGVEASTIQTKPFGEYFEIPAPDGEVITVMRPPA